MAEPSVVELFLKIERLEKELQAAQDLKIRLHNAEIMLAERDKQIANLQTFIKNKDSNISLHQNALEQAKTTVSNQNIELHNLSEQNKVKQSQIDQLKASLALACQQRDEFKQKLQELSNVGDTIKALQNTITKQYKVLQRLLQYLKTCEQYNTEFIESITAALQQ